MPRPKPLVSLHGSVNFDKLVPFDSAPDAPPLANNDILVMRKAAGGDNLTLSIADINATGSVNIAQLIGGNNNDMLFRVAGVWTGTGPTGLSYDGINMILSGDNLNFQGSGGVFLFGTGNIEQSGTGNIEVSGTGNIEISGGGSIMVSGGGTVEIEAAGGRLIISSGEANAILLESGSSILIEGAGGIVLDGSGDIELDTGQFLAADGSASSPSYSFAGQPLVGFSTGGVTNAVGLALGGVAQNTWEFTLGGISGVGSDRPSMRNVSATGTVPSLTPRNDDSNTGIGRNNPDELSLIAGAVEGIRVAESGGIITNTIFGDLITTGGGGSGPVVKNEGATATNPVFCPNQADPDTGFTRSGINQSSIVNGGVEALRLRSTTATIAAHTNLFVFDYDNGQLEIVSVGAADSGGAGFKLLRIAN
jgi:hypothetical protein